MGEEETKAEVPEVAENGTTSLVDKPAEAMAEGEEVKEDDKMKEMEEMEVDKDEQAETKKMDEDSEMKEEKNLKEDEETKYAKETKEEEGIEEEKGNEEIEEKEETKLEVMEEENGSNKMEVAGEKTGDKEDGEEKSDKAEDEKEKSDVAEDDKEKSDVAEDDKEKSDKAEDELRKDEETMKEKGIAKHPKGKRSGEKVREKKSKIAAEKKEPEPRTPVLDRPVRERKSVERLVASIEKDSSRELHIEKGRGTPLKDIPNVAFKMSRRKTDDTFRLLHSILYGKRGKALQVKSNISRFSGFVWHDNEEKQRSKMKEKFDKCNKEKLLEFCDVLDIQTARTTRKEDIVASLIDFLVAPHATTTVLLAEKESDKSNKRKRVTKQGSLTSGDTSSIHLTKSRRKSEGASKMRKKSTPDTDESEEEVEEKEEEKEEEEEEEKENGVPEKSDDEMPEQSESEDKDESEDESEEDKRKRKRTSKASSAKKESVGKSRTKKTTVSNKSSPTNKPPKKAAAKRYKADEDSDASPKVFSRKKKTEVVKEKAPTPAKSTHKDKPGKKPAKGKEKAKEDKLNLTDEKLREAICDILKEVDFNTATFSDILKLLAQKFDVDLTSRKSAIKLIIQEELTKLAEDEDEDGEGDAEKDEIQAVGEEVEA